MEKEQQKELITYTEWKNIPPGYGPDGEFIGSNT